MTAEIALAVALSTICAGGISYFAAVVQFRSRLGNVEHMVKRLDRRSLATLRIVVDIGHKEGVLNRITDNLSDLLLEEEAKS